MGKNDGILFQGRQHGGIKGSSLLTFFRGEDLAVHAHEVLECVAVMVNHLLEVAVFPVDLGAHFPGSRPHVAAFLPGLGDQGENGIRCQLPK